MVTFGKNESGGARFHAWVDQLLETSDGELTSLFQRQSTPSQKCSTALMKENPRNE